MAPLNFTQNHSPYKQIRIKIEEILGIYLKNFKLGKIIDGVAQAPIQPKSPPKTSNHQFHAF